MSSSLRTNDDINIALHRIAACHDKEAQVNEVDDIEIVQENKKRKVNDKDRSTHQIPTLFLKVQPMVYNGAWIKQGSPFRVEYKGNPNVSYRNTIQSLSSQELKPPIRLYLNQDINDAIDDISSNDLIQNEASLAASLNFFLSQHNDLNLINIKATSTDSSIVLNESLPYSMASSVDHTTTSSSSIIIESNSDVSTHLSSRHEKGKSLGEKVRNRLDNVFSNLRKENRYDILNKINLIHVSNKKGVFYNEEELLKTNEDDFALMFMGRKYNITFFSSKGTYTVRNTTKDIVNFLDEVIKQKQLFTNAITSDGTE